MCVCVCVCVCACACVRACVCVRARVLCVAQGLEINHIILCVIQDSLGVGGDVSYTCETAGHFYIYQVLSRWEAYMSKVKPLADTVSGQ